MKLFLFLIIIDRTLQYDKYLNINFPFFSGRLYFPLSENGHYKSSYKIIIISY